MKRYFIVLLLIAPLTVVAQVGSVGGANPTTVGTSSVYFYIDDGTYTNYSWAVTGGTTSNITHVGVRYNVTITWTTVGTQTIKLTDNDDGTLLASQTISVVSCSPATPTATFSYANNCGNTVITRTGTPPSGTSWYWQATSTGTSTTNSTTTYTATASGTYYLRPQMTCGSWGTAQTTSAVTVTPMPTVTASNKTICTGAASTAVTLTNNVASTLNTWTVSATNISGASNGSGTSSSSTPYTYTLSQALTSTGTGTATYTVTPSAGGCTGTPVNVTVTVAQVPTVAVTPISQNVNSGSATSFAISNPNGVTGTTFSWTAAQTNASGSSNGSGSTIAQTLSASGGTGTVTYTITPAANGCTGSPATATATVIPSVTTSGSVTLGSGSPSGGGTFTFCQFQTGSVIISLANPPGGYVNGSVSINGGSSTSICAGSGCSAPSNVTFANLAAGSYTVSYSLSTNYTSFSFGESVYATYFPGIVPTPNAVFSYSGNQCGTQTISYVASPPQCVTWYWQTSATGTATTNSTKTLSVTASGTYYLRPYDASLGVWGTAQPTNAMTYSPVPLTPAAPTATTNTCGPKTLSYGGTSQDGAAWYWQGTNSSGTDNISPAATAATYSAATTGSATYYIRAFNSYGCWSPAASISVVVDNPLPPPSQSTPAQFCEWDAISITAIPAVGTAKWYTSTNSFLYSGNTYSLVNLNIGTYTYNVTSIDANGCESQTSTPYTLIVSSNCDQYINWQEAISYRYNAATDFNPTVVADSKAYMDGFGKTIQTQVMSMSNGGQVLASDNIYDKLGNQTLATLSAPINSNAFSYRYRFTTNNDPGNVGSKQKYSWSDFDASTGPGSVSSPNPVGNNGLGTLGWYYSSANTLEPNTPVASYPYSRAYAPAGPNPTVTKSSGPGDAHKMGSGHESEADKFLIASGELSNYFNVRNYFNSSLYYNSASYIFNYTSAYAAINNFTSYLGSPTQSVASLVFTTGGSTGSPGFYPIDGSITVAPNSLCQFKVTGYTTINNANLASLHITDGAGNDIAWSAMTLPYNTPGTAQITFTVPTNVTSIKLGVQWRVASPGATLYVSSASFSTRASSTTPFGNAGYKYISIDADGKKTATFVDADGHTLANAIVTSTTGTFPNQAFTYDYWSYNFYNDLGQLVATVPPNGVNTTSNSKPTFLVTYTYDNQGRLIQTMSPDQGTSNFVYSTDGKIRFSQNQLQADSNRFSYTNYDYLGRPVESGQYTSSGTNPFFFEPSTNTPSSSYSVLSIVDNTIPQGFDIESISATTGSPNYYNGPSFTLDNLRCGDHMFIKYDLAQQDLPTGDNNHAQQHNLLGHVAKTKNANATTWYSYDEFGNAEWTVQNIVGLGNKTFDYTFDFLGNATQVGYQKSQLGQSSNEPFFHNFTYDQDGRLINVSTSLDGSTTGATITQQAAYKYYLHGPLKRVELAGNLQGVDYVYTIDGSLKSINNADLLNDPNHDGTANGFSPDVFGSTLNYFTGDYNGAGYNAGSVTTTNGSLNDNYDGNIKSTTWSTPIDGTPSIKMYGYSYDNLNRFSSAKWGTVTGSNGTYTGTLSPSNAYQEGVTSYDKNGNIMQLNRTGKTGNVTANYTYNYTNPLTNTQTNNQLQNVSDQTSGTALTTYQYNEIGQIKQQVESSTNTTMKIVYNAYGDPKSVTDANGNLMVSYRYDDRGNRVQQVFYNGSSVKTIFYVRGASGNIMAIYVQTTGAPVLTEMPIYGAGRIGVMKWKSGTAHYFYELNDHLGNVRAVLGPPTTDNFIATMEPANASTETKQFDNVAQTAVSHGAANSTPGGSYAARLNNGQSNGGYTGSPIGPGIYLTVAPGDVVSASVYAHYEGGSGYSQTIPVASMFTAAAGLFTPGLPTGEANTIANSFNQIYTGGFVGAAGSSNDAVPAAYLNLVMLDGNFLNDSSLPSAAAPLTNLANNALQKLTIGPITFTSPGYVYIYVNDNSNSNNWVYFDDVQVTHVHSTTVAGGDFYPFGLSMDDRHVTSEPYRYGYQGQFSEKDSVTNWNAFQLRMYEPRYGRWLSPDPYGVDFSPYIGMGNNPVVHIDPDGGCPDAPCFSWMDFAAQADALSEQYAAIGSRIISFSEIAISGTIAEVEDVAGGGGALYHSGAELEFSNLNYPKGDLGSGETFNSSSYYPPTRTADLTIPSPPRIPIPAISPPGTFESIIPVWGSGRSAVAAFSAGNYWQGVFWTGMAISDVFLVKALATAAIKGALTLAAKNVAKNVVYHGVDNAGVVRYVGITARDPAIRFAEHLGSVGTGKELLRYEVLRDATNLSRIDARILEQKLINIHGLQKTGNLLNKINSIAPSKWAQYGIN